jgi:hypothetical protein
MAERNSKPTIFTFFFKGCMHACMINALFKAVIKNLTNTLVVKPNGVLLIIQKPLKDMILNQIHPYPILKN